MNHTCLFLSSRNWYSFTDPWGMEDWVGLGGWLHNEINFRQAEKVHWRLSILNWVSLSPTLAYLYSFTHSRTRRLFSLTHKTPPKRSVWLQRNKYRHKCSGCSNNFGWGTDSKNFALTIFVFCWGNLEAAAKLVSNIENKLKEIKTERRRYWESIRSLDASL